jgi:hypothetical protein
MRRVLHTRGLCAVAAILSLTACTHAAPGPKMAQKGLDAMTPQQRRATLESTTQALDTRPEYVDELYAIARKHPKTFERFLADTTRDLHERALAQLTVGQILEHPDSYRQMLLVALESSSRDPKGADVLTTAMVDRRGLIADMITARPAKLIPVTEAIMRTGAPRPEARAALRTSMSDEAEPVAHILVEDPKTVGVLMKALLKAGVSRSVLELGLADKRLD